MSYNNMSELIRAVEQRIAVCMPMIGEEIQLIMTEAIETDIYQDHDTTMYQRTGDLLETPTVLSFPNNTGVVVEYMDKGDWYSVRGDTAGEHFFPLLGYLAGSVWAPNDGYYSADPTETAFEVCQEEIPHKLATLLRAGGLIVK